MASARLAVSAVSLLQRICSADLQLDGWTAQQAMP